MESKTEAQNLIHKPSKWTSKILNFLGFINPEDLFYKYVQNHFHYMNYGMETTENTPDYDGLCEEEINYLELFNIGKPILGMQLDILEIGCGFGYGSQCINKVFKPKSLLAIDRAKNAILYANNHFDTTSVTYIHNCFSDEIAQEKSLDVIYTVETGGKFPIQESFHLAYKLLKPGGVFLVANINPRCNLVKKKEFAKNAGFELFKEKDVTAQVISYLESDRKKEKIKSAIRKLPFPIRILGKVFSKQINEFIRLPSSKSFELLGTNEFYYHFCFRK